MILQCPACDARFKVGAGAIPASGRKVRCARCMHEWHAVASDLLKPEPARPAPPPPVREPAAERPAAAAPASRPAEDEIDTAMAAAASPMNFEDDETSDAEVINDPDLPPPGAAVTVSDKPLFSADAFAAAMKSAGSESEPLSARRESPEIRDEYRDDDDDDFLARRRAEQRRQSEVDRVGRRRRLVLFLWILLVLFWVGLGAAFFGMKDTIKHAWPKSAVVYGWFESQNDTSSLKEMLEKEGKPLSKPITEAKAVLAAYLESSSVEDLHGEQVLMVKGYVKNEGNRSAMVPQVEIVISDSNGRPVDRWVVDPPARILTQGGKVEFEAPRSPIPAGAASAEVKLLEGTESKGTVDTSNLYERSH